MYLRCMRWLRLWIMLLRCEVRLRFDAGLYLVAETKEDLSTVGTARTEHSEGV